MYDPDRMPDPVRGDRLIDELDEQITWMNYAIWADDISDARARSLKARYYGEISYIDDCLGRILDAVEATDSAENTLVCFFSDHGDHLGDHRAWQKESFFDGACRVPFLVSWPCRLPSGTIRHELVCLTDLFGIATEAAGAPEFRDGVDVLGLAGGPGEPRGELVGYYGEPGTALFKVMVRTSRWKYVFVSNGGYEMVFDVAADPHEKRDLSRARPDVAGDLRHVAVGACATRGATAALVDGELRAFLPFERERTRIYQFHHLGGGGSFPDRPEDTLSEWRARRREPGGAD
jgi:choline-sulfatase